MKKELILLVFGCLLVQKSMSQAQPVVPLTPEAAELFKYTSTPVSMMTGVPQISYPLYEVNTGKLKLPISLNYHASGIKVTQKATWVGLGWSLMAGGTISRSVRGTKDEDSNRGWFNHNKSVDSLVTVGNYFTLLNLYQGTPDIQPDFFSYNLPGKSGRFIYSRETHSFVTIPYQPIIINWIASNNTYVITDDDGTIYYYEQKLSALQDDVGLQQSITGWNLTRIVSNDKSDTLYLNYDVGASGGDKGVETVTTFTRSFVKESTDFNYTSQGEASSTTHTSYSTIKLKEIIFRQGKVTFFANTIRQDYSGNALDSIIVYSKEGASYQKVRKISFNYSYYYDGRSNPLWYDYRLKLLSFTAEDVNGGQPEQYKFDYNNTPLPATLSYAADYWGFYNGADGNFTLMPAQLASHSELQQFGNLGSANRNPSDAFIQAGILNKVTYPTGGYTTLKYESNKYESRRVRTVNKSLAYIKLNGTGRNSIVTKSADFQAVSQFGYDYQTVTINVNFSAYSANAITVAQSLTLKDLTTGTNIMTWASTSFQDYDNAHSFSYNYSCNTSHTYQLIATINDYSTTSIEAAVSNPVTETVVDIKSGGGVRVQSVNYYDNNDTLQRQEVYKYSPDESGIGVMLFSANDMIDGNYYEISTVKTEPAPAGCKIKYGNKIVYLGQSTYPSVNFQGATVLYPYVTKYEYGNGIPNGKSIYQYKVPNDYTIIPQPNAVGGREIIDNTLYEEFLDQQEIYKYDGIFKLQRRINNNYSLYNAASETAYLIWQTTEYGQVDDACDINLGGPTDFRVIHYLLRSGGYRLTSTKEQEYDENGNVLENTVNYTYNAYAYPATISRLNSKQNNVINVMYYPGDQPANDPNAAVLNKMVSKNMIRVPYWKGKYNNSTLLSYQRTRFRDQWSSNANLIAPESDTISYSGNNASLAAGFISYESYDKYGNIRQLKDQNGITSSYTWSMNGAYPISQTIGASVNQVLYDGFEDTGSWTGILSDAAQAYSGSYAGLTNTAGTYANPNWINISLSAATKFKYSGWIYSSGPAAAITLLIKKAGETGAYSYIDNVSTGQTGKWVYVEKEYPVPADASSLTIRLDNNGSGKVWFDDIRLRPLAAEMSTFTYKPLIGMTSKNDEGNHIIYYEYDGSGRLKSVKDKDGKILKYLDYRYQQSVTQ